MGFVPLSSRAKFTEDGKNIENIEKPKKEVLYENLENVESQWSTKPMSRPMELLDRSLNKVILIRLKGQRELRGVLKSFDAHLNLILETAEDLAANGERSDLGTILVRGDNVVFISPPAGDTQEGGD